MATVNWASVPFNTFGELGATVTWTPLTTTNLDGQAFAMPAFADRSIHVYGTFGATATLTIQGSNEATPTQWVTLAAAGDPAEDMIFLTAGGNDIKQILEVCRFIRPLLSGGDGTTALTVQMLIRR
jgi:lysophospholipase L1-like esterase